MLEVKYKNGTASVIINEVFPEDCGRYACKATNAKGSVETSTKISILPMAKKSTNGKVNGASAMASAPRIYQHVLSSIAKDGEPVKLECTITGDSRFDVVWLHNEKEIKPSKDFIYKTVGSNTHVLEIVEVFPEDAGTYTCEAFNEIGECFSTCSLVVEVPGEELPQPAFKTFPKSLTVEKGQSASFMVEMIDSKPPKEVTWMKDGKVIQEVSMKNRIKATKNRLELDIMDCGTTDSGQYAIIVNSEKGENKASFSLNVN